MKRLSIKRRAGIFLIAMGILGSAQTLLAQDFNIPKFPVGNLIACAQQLVASGNIQIQKDSFSDQSCFVSIHPYTDVSPIYRDYLATDSGMLMVFNSYGEGPPSTKTGAREFYFFPRTRKVDFKVDPRSGDVSVFMANGDEFIFDVRTAQLKSVGKGRVQLDHSINPDNRGGVEFTQYKGLYLDVGFALGHDPASDADRTVIAHLQNGDTCQLKVSNLFTNLANDPTLKFNDDELTAFLQKSCN